MKAINKSGDNRDVSIIGISSNVHYDLENLLRH